jgi:hypothetical protein
MKKAISVLLLAVFISPAFSQDFKFSTIGSFWKGSYVIAGLLENVSSTSYSYVSIGITGKDKSGSIVYTDSTYTLGSLYAKSSSPFSFFIDAQKAGLIENYSFTINRSSQGQRGTYSFDFTKLSIIDRNNTYHKYVAEIKNKNTFPCERVRVAFLGFDSSKKLVYYEDTFADVSIIQPGGSSTFSFFIPVEHSAKIATYQLVGFDG